MAQRQRAGAGRNRLPRGGEKSSGGELARLRSTISVTLGEPALLTPHRAVPRVRQLKVKLDDTIPVPSILLSYEAYCDTMHLIAEAGADELAWLGSVRQVGKARYLIDRIFLFRQWVSLAHCELDTDDIGTFLDELLRQDPANRALADRLRFWGHLHPLDTAPTRADEKQMDIFAESPWFIRGIFTRTGRGAFTFFDYRRGVNIHDCPWGIAVADGGRKAAIAAEVREKVQRVPVPKEVLDGVQLTCVPILGLPSARATRG